MDRICVAPGIYGVFFLRVTHEGLGFQGSTAGCFSLRFTRTIVVSFGYKSMGGCFFWFKGSTAVRPFVGSPTKVVSLGFHVRSWSETESLTFCV